MKKEIKKKYDYTKVWVKCALAYSTGGEYESDGPYANRETECRHYEVEDYFLVTNPNKCGFDSVAVPDWKEGTDTIYLVMVHYSTGDTFGRTEGCIDVPIAFVDVNEANTVAKKIDSTDYKKLRNTDEQFLDSKYGYHKGWTGYFEHMNGVEVKKLTLQGTGLYKSVK